MKKIFIASCNKPSECLENFQNTITTFENTAPLTNDRHVIVTIENYELVKKKFEDKKACCDVNVNIIYAENNEGKRIY